VKNNITCEFSLPFCLKVVINEPVVDMRVEFGLETDHEHTGISCMKYCFCKSIDTNMAKVQNFKVMSERFHDRRFLYLSNKFLKKRNNSYIPLKNSTLRYNVFSVRYELSF
jgi:hypothetical protein